MYRLLINELYRLSLAFFSKQQWLVYGVSCLATYLCLVHTLRFRRLIETRHSFNYLTSSSVCRMTLSSAFLIHNNLIQLEFPLTFSIATTFALFKAYGIPSISCLLVKTNQLAGPYKVSSKRYADTGALLLEAVLNEPGSQRSADAIARINWLHDRHRKSGNISDEDMLYTLSLFALQPMTWVKKYEWRQLDDIEICAVATLWKYLGDALKVPFDILPGHRKGWRDGLEWIRELEAWSQNYEERYMVPADTNRKLAEMTFRIILHKLPKVLHGWGRSFLAGIMETKLREAMLHVMTRIAVTNLYSNKT